LNCGKDAFYIEIAVGVASNEVLFKPKIKVNFSFDVKLNVAKTKY